MRLLDRLRGRSRERAGARLLRALAAEEPDAFFIEVGANDGEQHDHLHPIIFASRWRGLLVEPVPYVFERLERNLGDDPRFKLENAAVADRDGTLPFYHLARAEQGDDLPPWYDGLGSFSRDTILSHADKISDIADRLVTAQVPCLTFESLCRKHGVDRLDVLLIDAEGYDWEIVRRLDLEARHPRVLVYEHYHLPAPVRAEARAHLEARGYRTVEEGFDTWCLSERAGGRLSPVWEGLEPVDPPFSADEHPA